MSLVDLHEIFANAYEDSYDIMLGRAHNLQRPLKGGYYINGKNITKEEWEQHPLRVSYLQKEEAKKLLGLNGKDK